MSKTQMMLEDHNYKPIVQCNGIRVGSRVRNAGQQWATAAELGTAVVTAVMEKTPSSWSQTYGARDIEVVVLRDDGTEGQWSSYGTVLSWASQDALSAV
jgi:hypothetical protein